MTFTGTIASESVVKAGDGNDTLIFGSGDYQSSQILLGGGADSIVIGNNTETVSGSDAKLGLGAGADTLTLDVNDFNSATIIGGGGADSITISGMGTESSVLINLDSTVNGGGGDTLELSDAIGEDSTIKGKGGADFITVSGGVSLSSRVEGNAGGDSITISGVVATTGQFIGGGQGNDTIVIADITESGFMTIQGGGGNDSIDLLSFSGQDNFIFGGAGADTIDFGTLHSGEIGFSAFTDSTLTSMDTLTGAATVSGMTLNFSAANQTFATGVLASTQTGVSATITDGGQPVVVTSAQGVTARVAILDEASGVKGTTFYFDATESGATVNYLFVQGGTTGETSDDLVVKLSLAQSGQVVNLETDYKIDLQT